jgi:hypothetical protein
MMWARVMTDPEFIGRSGAQHHHFDSQSCGRAIPPHKGSVVISAITFSSHFLSVAHDWTLHCGPGAMGSQVSLLGA